MENSERNTVNSQVLVELAHECHLLLDEFLAIPLRVRTPAFHTKVLTYHMVEGELRGLYTQQLSYPKREFLD